MEDLKYKKSTVAARKKEAMKWYKDITKSTKPSASTFEIYREETGLRGRLAPGYLQHFTYLAKHRDKLPYWDAFPLSLTMNVGEDHMLNLNLHYLSYSVREKVLKVMYDNLVSTKSPTAKVKFNYEMLKEMQKYSFMKPAIKKHLFSQIKTKPILIPPSDFNKVLFLPSEEFVGATNTKVWRDSARMAKK